MRIACAIVCVIAVSSTIGVATARGQGSPPPGYTVTKVSTGLSTADVENITQMAFKPGDPDHVYATRFGFGNFPADGGVVTRYDYSAATGGLSNPVNVATGLDLTGGLAFLGNTLYVSTTQNVFQPNSTGGIYRLQDLGNGMYGNAVEFVNNIPLGDHQVDQLQISGNSLYMGIGTRTNTGDPTQESVYNGTIGRIDDLTKANYSAAGADNLALSAVLTDTDPGKLHVYASGFRNPFGVRVDASGNVSATDNGADPPSLTPDLFYTNIHKGDQGIFPSGTGTIQPLTRLGLDTSADGFAVLPSGPLQGQYLVALFNTASSGTPVGNELVTVDPTTGAVTPFLTGIGNPLDIVTDPYGRLLVSDYGPSFYNGFDPSSGGVYLISPSAVPEPSSGVLLLISSATVAVSRFRRRKSNDKFAATPAP